MREFTSVFARFLSYLEIEKPTLSDEEVALLLYYSKELLAKVEPSSEPR